MCRRMILNYFILKINDFAISTVQYTGKIETQSVHVHVLNVTVAEVVVRYV